MPKYGAMAEVKAIRCRVCALPTALGVAVLLLCAMLTPPLARADNLRLNQSVADNVETIKLQAGCQTQMRFSPQLQFAAQRHAEDVLGNHDLDGDLGTDGSTVQTRAGDAGYRGVVAETVATINSLAINAIDIMGNWYYRPDYYAIMSNCANTQIGVWSVNSFNRSVAVAVYGQPG